MTEPAPAPAPGPDRPAPDEHAELPPDSSSRTPRARPALLIALAVVVMVSVIGFVVLQLAGGHSEDAPGGRDQNSMSQESSSGDPTGPVREDR